MQEIRKNDKGEYYYRKGNEKVTIIKT